MRVREERPREKESSAAAAIVVSALLAFNLFVVGPCTVYAGNAGEYSAAFSSVLGHLAGAALLSTLAMVAMLLLCPRRFRGRPEPEPLLECAHDHGAGFSLRRRDSQ